jgi:hypothetical protein
MSNARFFKDTRTIIEFRALGLDHGKIDREKGVIHDVSLITAGIEARGHDLHTDDVTLEQVCALANEMGQVPVKWNHKTGADSVNGYVSNFRVAGNKTKADWHLLQSHSQYEHALELAERMPQNIGLSVAFVPLPPETKNGKNCARVEELISVDLVAQPAANPGGLFEMVDIPPADKLMSDQNKNAAGAVQEPTLADVLEEIKGQGETMAALLQRVEGIESTQRGDQPLSLEELEQIAQLDDTQLAELNLTRAEVDTAVAEAMANAETGDNPNAADPNAADPNAGAARTAVQPVARRTGDIVASGAAAQPAASEVMAELHDLRKRMVFFEKKETLKQQREEQEALDTFFDSLEKKIAELETRNQALETAFKAGGGSVTAAGEFVMPAGSGHGDGKNGKTTEFEQLVDAKIVELTTADSKMSKISARVRAIEFVQGSNRAAYTKHLEAKGVGITFED